MSTVLGAMYEPRRATAGARLVLPPAALAVVTWERAAYFSSTLSKKRV
jgi:hypothetical protein